MIGVVVVMVGVLVVVLGLIGVPVVPVVVNCVVGLPVVHGDDTELGKASGNWTSPFTLKIKQESSVLVLLLLLSMGRLVQFSRSFII